MYVKPIKKKYKSLTPADTVRKAIGYLEGTHDGQGKEREVAPKLVRGDPDLWRDLVQHGRQKGKYTSTVLSFTETDLSDDTLQDIMQSFEQACHPGLDPSRYCAVWYLHRDKGITELHCLFANEELQSGKKINQYVHKFDNDRLRTHWATMINAKYDLTDPLDPARRRIVDVTDRKNLPKDKAQLVTLLNDFLMDQIDQGKISDRAGVIDCIQKEVGLKVTRVINSRISIENPNNPGGQPITLKGGMFEKGFNYDPETRKKEIEAFKNGRPERLANATIEYQKLYDKKAQFNREVYDFMPARRIARNTGAEIRIGDFKERRQVDDINDEATSEVKHNHTKVKKSLLVQLLGSLSEWKPVMPGQEGRNTENLKRIEKIKKENENAKQQSALSTEDVRNLQELHDEVDEVAGIYEDGNDRLNRAIARTAEHIRKQVEEARRRDEEMKKAELRRPTNKRKGFDMDGPA